jgi:hypothetical protein
MGSAGSSSAARHVSKTAIDSAGIGSAGTPADSIAAEKNVNVGGANVSGSTTMSQNTERQERYSAISGISGDGASPNNNRPVVSRAPGAAGMSSPRPPHSDAKSGARAPTPSGAAGTQSRRDSDSGNQRHTGVSDAGHNSSKPGVSPSDSAGTPVRTPKSSAALPHTQASPDRQRGNTRPPSPNAQTKASPGAAETAPQENTLHPAETRRQTRGTHAPDSAGMSPPRRPPRADAKPSVSGFASPTSSNTPKQTTPYNPKHPVFSNTAKSGVSPDARRGGPGIAGNAAKAKKRKRRRGHR